MAKANQDNTRSYALTTRNYDFAAIAVNSGTIKGFQATVVIGADNKIIAQNNPNKVDVETLAKVIKEVAQSFNKGTKELGIGKFHTSELDGPWGHIYINVLGDKTLITQCDKSAHGDDVLARLERIIESCSRS